MEKKQIEVTCECEGTGFIAVADNGGDGIEHVECGQHHPAFEDGEFQKVNAQDEGFGCEGSVSTLERDQDVASDCLTDGKYYANDGSLDVVCELHKR